MVERFEVFHLRGGVFVVYPALAAVPLNVDQLVDAQGVPLVEGDVVELSDGRRGFSGGGVLNKGKPGTSSAWEGRQQRPPEANIPQ